MDATMQAELEPINAAAAALQKDYYSTDPQIAARAKAEMGEVTKRFEAWAKKHRLALARHEVDNADAPEVRRKCATIISTVIGGKINWCMLVGREGRKCLYSCAPAGATNPAS